MEKDALSRTGPNVKRKSTDLVVRTCCMVALGEGREVAEIVPKSSCGDDEYHTVSVCTSIPEA